MDFAGITGASVDAGKEGLKIKSSESTSCGSEKVRPNTSQL
jgi:hypothetical protein